MAIAEITLHSNSLGTNSSVTVCMPECPDGGWKPGVKYQVLWLMPGGGGDGSEWARFTCIEQYALQYNFFAISPATYMSLYTDMYYGNPDKFFTYISEELPQMMRWMFPISTAKEDNFVAGFSMGGYGAFKLAMTYPDSFAALGTFGGVHDMVDTVTRNHLHDGVLDRHFFLAFNTVEDLVGSKNDAMYLAEKNAERGNFGPRMFFSVGEDDFCNSFNVRARDRLTAKGYEITWDVAPGNHSYLYCESRLKTFIEWAGFRGTPISVGAAQ